MIFTRHHGALRTALLALGILLIAAVTSCGRDTAGLDDGLYARIITEKGDITIRLEPERAPLTTMNFVGLAEGTLESGADSQGFYDGLTFHRVEPGFVIQGGDPAGNGTGGPAYRFPTETHPQLLHDDAGVVAMANSGPDTNGSQFYITMAATPHLDGSYNVFGHVVSGMDVVNAIEVGDVMERVEIIRVGAEAQDYVAEPAAFQALIQTVLSERAARQEAEREAARETIREQWPGAEVIPGTDLRLVTRVAGSGASPSPGDTVAVHFTFKLLDGTQLDDTRARGEPYVFVWGRERLIPGLERAIGEMREGGSAVAIIPPELAFGSTGIPPVVAPNSYVVFDIDLISIE
jgi:peptidylprolyl isomerase